MHIVAVSKPHYCFTTLFLAGDATHVSCGRKLPRYELGREKRSFIKEGFQKVTFFFVFLCNGKTLSLSTVMCMKLILNYISIHPSVYAFPSFCSSLYHRSCRAAAKFTNLFYFLFHCFSRVPNAPALSFEVVFSESFAK